MPGSSRFTGQEEAGKGIAWPGEARGWASSLSLALLPGWALPTRVGVKGLLKGCVLVPSSQDSDTAVTSVTQETAELSRVISRIGLLGGK